MISAMLPLLVAAASLPLGGDVDQSFSLNLLLTEPSYSNCGAFDRDALDECADLGSDPHPAPSFLWVIASRVGGFVDGIDGVEFGISHSGINILTWSVCGGTLAEWGNWPESGTGIAMSFGGTECSAPGENVPVGIFFIENGDTGMMLLTAPPDRQTRWNSCVPEGFEICAEGLAAANLDGGTNSVCGCGGTPLEEVGWSRIKTLFGRN